MSLNAPAQKLHVAILDALEDLAHERLGDAVMAARPPTPTPETLPSELVETALRLLLRAPRTEVELPPLPSFRSGGALVDVADRDSLYQAMEGR